LDVEFYGCKGEPFSKDNNCKWNFCRSSISQIQCKSLRF